MAQFIEKTPNGLETWVDDDHEPGLSVHYRQDFEPILNHATQLRNDPTVSDKGIKQDFWLYAVLPPVVIMDLKIRLGIDVFNRNHQKRMLEVINRDYPWLKATNKTHEVKH